MRYERKSLQQRFCMAAIHFFARYLYVPMLLIGLNGLAVYLVVYGYRYVWLFFTPARGDWIVFPHGARALLRGDLESKP